MSAVQVTKKFPIGVVLSATTGFLLTNIDNMYDILSFLTGQDLYTHLLPKALRWCAPLLEKQFPQLEKEKEFSDDFSSRLKEIPDLPGRQEVVMEKINEYLKEAGERCGKELEVPSFSHLWGDVDPLLSLFDMVGDKGKVVVVEVGE